MSKTLWIIIAVLLIICGAILFALAGMQVHWDFRNLDSKNFVTNTYEVTEKFENIAIESFTGKIKLLPATDGVCRVECYENEKMKHSVSVIDGALTVNCTDERGWRDHITFFNFKSPLITLYLPECEYAALTVKGTTGDVFVGEEFTFTEANIKVTTGDVLFRANVNGELGIKVTTGDVALENISAGSISLNITTGDVKVQGIDCAGEIYAKGSTGSCKFENVRCASFECDLSTGDVELYDLIAKGNIRLECTTGDIRLTACDAGELFIKTTSGDVKASLLSEKVFKANATSGSVKVPFSGSGGLCEIETTSGDITVTVK